MAAFFRSNERDFGRGRKEPSGHSSKNPGKTFAKGNCRTFLQVIVGPAGGEFKAHSAENVPCLVVCRRPRISAPKISFAGFDHIARIRARQPRDMAARRLMLELDRASHIHLPAQQCGATLASPLSDHSSFNRLYALWAGEEGLSGNRSSYFWIAFTGMNRASSLA